MRARFVPPLGRTPRVPRTGQEGLIRKLRVGIIVVFTVVATLAIVRFRPEPPRPSKEPEGPDPSAIPRVDLDAVRAAGL